MKASPTRRGKKDPVAHYEERAGQLGITSDDVLNCSVKISGKKCCECDELAVERNRSHCVKCAAYWLPEPGDAGAALLGPAFMRRDSNPANKQLCCCGLALCHDIGYCGRGRFTLPKDAQKRQDWFDMAGMPNVATDPYDPLNTKKNYMAYWHFAEDRRFFNATTQMWELHGPAEPYEFADGGRTKRYSHLVPNNPLRSFIDETRAARRKAKRALAAIARRELDSSAPATKRRRSEGDDLHRAQGQLLRAEVAEEDARGVRASEAAMLDSAKVGSAEDLIKHLAELLEATGAGSLPAAVGEVKRRRAAAAAAAGGEEEGGGVAPGLKPLRYADCTDADIDAFTYHRDREEYDSFLNMVNFKEDSDDEDDEGELSRLRYFSHSKKKERDGGGERKRKEGGGRKRKLHYVDEYLCWSCYIHCGWTEKQTARLFGIALTTVGDVVRTWTVYLDQAFACLLPNPTKPELLRSYPDHFIRVLGHARAVMNLDATDTKGETSRFSDSQSACFSTYHHQTGGKTLAGCTPIGTVPHPWVTATYPSAISDEAMTEKTGILANLREYDAVNVDRGFCIENLAIAYHLLVIRPQKKMHNQTQFSLEDSNMHHKVGTTRIVIEQKNAHAKRKCGYLQRITPATQFDMLSAVIRVAFSMTNFSAPVTTGVHSGSTGNRACCAGVLYLGHVEPETTDARAHPELWCTKTQLAIHGRLSSVLVDMPAEHVSELVLLETCLEESASEDEITAREKWVACVRRLKYCTDGNNGKKNELRSVAAKTLAAVDEARKADGRLGVF